MSKTQLQTNNTRLASMINELKGKAAGSGPSGGESAETCTVTVSVMGDSPMLPTTMWYVDSDGQPAQVTEANDGIDDDYTVLKGSLLVFDIEADSYTTANGNVTILNTTPMLICGVTGDGYIGN